MDVGAGKSMAWELEGIKTSEQLLMTCTALKSMDNEAFKALAKTREKKIYTQKQSQTRVHTRKSCRTCECGVSH